MSQSEPLVYQVDVAAPPDQVWRSLTDPELTRQYYFDTRVESDWTPGSGVAYRNAQGGVDLEGEVIEFDPPRRLVTTFKPAWAPAVEGAPPSTVAWEVEPAGEGSRLTLTHRGADPEMAEMLDGSWRQALAGLKGVLEGEPAPAG